MKTYVCGFLISKLYDRILMVEKKKPDFQRGKYNGIGGSVEQGEVLLHAMCREFSEETGLIGYTDWSETGCIEGKDFSVHFYKQFVRDLPNFPLSSYDVENSWEKPWVNDIGENLVYLEYSKLLTGGYRDQTLLNLNWIIPFIHFSREDNVFYIQDPELN